MKKLILVINILLILFPSLLFSQQPEGGEVNFEKRSAGYLKMRIYPVSMVFNSYSNYDLDAERLYY